MVLHRHDLGWIIPSLLYVAATVRFVTIYISTENVTDAVKLVGVNVCYDPFQLIPEKLRLPSSAAGTFVVFLIRTFATETSADNTRSNRAVSLFGLLVMIAALYGTSRDCKKIDWQTVIVGMLLQYLLALFVLRTKAGVSSRVVTAYLT